ncbi:MAG: transcriptional regulator [Thiohalospira sp.]
MNKKIPEIYTSPLIEDLLNEISPEELKRTERKMMLAARIDEVLKARGMKKGDLAKALDKNPSEISKWLSGTHNFTAETLWEIGDVLGINLINIEEQRKEPVVYVASVMASDSDNQKIRIQPTGYCELGIIENVLNQTQFDA